jgi:poly-gamma-glutamate synthesis protein (capsule biosynthesis protein)
MFGMKTKILFSGDFAPIMGYEKIALQKKELIFNDALEIINEADLSFVNLECPLTISNKKITKSGPCIKSNPKAIECLKPFTVIGLANNHCLDFGQEGLQDTINACNSQSLPYVGAGFGDKIIKPYYWSNQDVSIAIIAIAEKEFNFEKDFGACLINPRLNLEAINEAKAKSDYIIITLHGGNEYFNLPRPKLRELCKYFIDLGVNAVICHHPHVPGGYEVYKDSPIVYSLGNLIFDNIVDNEEWNDGYFFQLNLDKNKLISFELIPYRQSVKLKGVQLLKGKEKLEFLLKISALRHILENKEEELVALWENFLETKKNMYISKMFIPFTFFAFNRLQKMFPFINTLLMGKNKIKKLNILRCASHLEALETILNTKTHD